MRVVLSEPKHGGGAEAKARAPWTPSAPVPGALAASYRAAPEHEATGARGVTAMAREACRRAQRNP